MAPGRQPHHTSVFNTLHANKPDDQKQLIDFYQDKYKLKDLSKVHTSQTYSRSNLSNMRMEELRMVNPEVLKRYNLGTIDQLM